MSAPAIEVVVSSEKVSVRTAEMLRHTKTKNPASGLPVRGSVFA
jgi:hypothetical protein